MSKKEIVLNQSKTKRVTYAVVFLIVTLIYTVMYKNKFLNHDFGLILITFCGAVSIYFIFRVCFPKPALVINEQGISQKVKSKKGIIEWEKIKEIYICVVPKRKYDTYYLGIKYRKDENDKRKIKFKGKVDKKIGDKTIILDELEMEPYEIYNKIQKYYSKFIRK